MFISNLNSLDRILRLILGIAILCLAFIGPQTPFGYAGLILIITAFINFCPLYKVFGIDTSKE